MFRSLHPATSSTPAAAHGHLAHLALRPSIVAALSAALVACGGGGDDHGHDSAETSAVPSFVEQPAGTSLASGGRAEFHARAEAAGHPISYQWYLDDEPIEGATRPSLILDEVDANHHGARVSVQAESDAGSVSSDAALITIDDADVEPLLDPEVHADSLASGETRLSVKTTGTGTFSYQWRHGGTDIPGATGAEHVVPATDATPDDDKVGYSVVVSNRAGGSTASREKVLQAAPAGGPEIVTPPLGVTKMPGQRATFTVKYRSHTRMSIQWLRDGRPIPGATRPSYTTSALRLADHGVRFTVTLTNVISGEVTRLSATLKVVEATAPTISRQPVDAWLAAGKAATFSVTAGGTTPHRYRWFRNGRPIADATAPSYTTSRLTASDDAASYHVTITNPAGSVTSRVARVRISGLASTYPAKPIQIVVPYAAGGTSDAIGRALAARLGNELRQPVTVTNVAGSNGALAAGLVARSAADGHTLLLGGSEFVTAALVYRTSVYAPTSDFTMLGVAAERPLVLMGRGTLPSNYGRLLPWLKANGSKTLMATAGTGSVSDLCARLFKDEVGVAMTTIPYRGEGPAIADLQGGLVDLYCGTPPQPHPATLRTYGLTDTKRSSIPALAPIPTLDSRGLDGFRVGFWYGLQAPAATPTAVIAKVDAAMRRIRKDPEFVADLQAAGVQVVTDTRSTPKGHSAHVRAELARWAPLLKDLSY